MSFFFLMSKWSWVIVVNVLFCPQTGLSKLNRDLDNGSKVSVSFF